MSTTMSKELQRDIDEISRVNNSHSEMIVSEHNGIYYLIGVPYLNDPSWKNQNIRQNHFFVWAATNGRLQGWEEIDQLPFWFDKRLITSREFKPPIFEG